MEYKLDFYTEEIHKALDELAADGGSLGDAQKMLKERFGFNEMGVKMAIDYWTSID